MNNNSNSDSQFGENGIGENGIGSKRKRLTQACDVCRRKKVVLSKIITGAAFIASNTDAPINYSTTFRSSVMV